ncbi:hypothetical protein O6P43_021381 [Quillaja saponaria]|uniref:Uncharacterized protein n=1 Tax=Quillaja saponaria TaxID=32244 RepID=A0AAD7LAX7_QUISA|nr:hypothetical protein O6P43_021381 [Quillaja saponaria]
MTIKGAYKYQRIRDSYKKEDEIADEEYDLDMDNDDEDGGNSGDSDFKMIVIVKFMVVKQERKSFWRKYILQLTWSKNH